jgi:hypothetical protein
MSAGFVTVITNCNVVMVPRPWFGLPACACHIYTSIPVTNRDKADISHRHITIKLGAMKITEAASA